MQGRQFGDLHAKNITRTSRSCRGIRAAPTPPPVSQTRVARLIDRDEPGGRLTIGFALRTTLAFGKHF